ncbi:unnamed protein product [Amoebophrya sp. A25]|nr:unnamed protein product [Amoebophrya sp. A25]|eukprot:GSA25T00020128001.1
MASNLTPIAVCSSVQVRRFQSGCSFNIVILLSDPFRINYVLFRLISPAMQYITNNLHHKLSRLPVRCSTTPSKQRAAPCRNQEPEDKNFFRLQEEDEQSS